MDLNFGVTSVRTRCKVCGVCLRYSSTVCVRQWSECVCRACAALPFLRQTRVLLYPMTLMFVVYVVSVALRWNMTLKLCNFYYYRL